MASYERKMRELGLGDGNGVNLADRVGSTNNAAPTGRSAIPASDPRNRASPGQ